MMIRSMVIIPWIVVWIGVVVVKLTWSVLVISKFIKKLPVVVIIITSSLNVGVSVFGILSEEAEDDDSNNDERNDSDNDEPDEGALLNSIHGI